MGRNRKKLMQQYPDQPWMWQKDWISGRLQSINKIKMVRAVCFAILFNVLSLFGTIAAFSETDATSDKAVFLVLLLPIVGIGFAVQAIRYVFAYRKFGKSVFIMASVPGVIGGELRGVVETKVNIIPEDGFRITLRCIRRTVTGRGKNSHVKTDVLWEDSRVMKREILESDLTRSHIPILFAIPYDVQQTNKENSRNSILWQLEVEAKVPGMDYSTKFEVPVFKTEESSAEFILDECPVADYTAKLDTYDELKAADITIEPLPNGATRFIFPTGGMMKSAVKVLIMFLFFTVLPFVIFLSEGPILFVISTSLGAIMILPIVISCWMRPTTIEACPNSIILTGSLICSSRRKEVKPSNVSDIVPRQNMSSGNNHYFDLKIMQKKGGILYVGGSIMGRNIAQKFADEIKLAISKQE